MKENIPSINNFHESHDKADLWQKLLKYGIKSIDEEGNITKYNRYNIKQLEELLEQKEEEQKKAA